jgi:hypothetical protein
MESDDDDNDDGGGGGQVRHRVTMAEVDLVSSSANKSTARINTRQVLQWMLCRWSITYLEIRGIQLNGRCGISNGSTIVFDMQLARRAIGKQDRVRWVL